jgi:hypothetical protein
MNNNDNIYESIYHLKKMFPKFELDIVESILRGNNGNIEATVDQLLSISVIDDDTIKNKEDSSASLYLNSNDLPPSYNDIIPKSKQQQQQNSNQALLTIQKKIDIKKDDRILKKLNSVLVGDLPRDFLRIKLNSQQLKLIKKTDEKYKNKKSKVFLFNFPIYFLSIILIFIKIESTIIKNCK